MQPGPQFPVNTAVNYYRARNEYLNADGVALQTQIYFGQTHTHAALTQQRAYNDLPNGYLPDDRSGFLTSIQVCPFFTADAAVIASLALNQASAWAVHDWIKNSHLKLYINNVSVVEGPVEKFPHPPLWFAADTEGAANLPFMMIQNGGYMLFTINQEIKSRQRIRVEITTDPLVAIDADAEVIVDVDIQVADNKPINI